MTSLALVFAAALAASTAAPTPGLNPAEPRIENFRTAPLSRGTEEQLTRPLAPRATAPARDLNDAPVRRPNMSIWWVIGGFAAVIALALYSRANERQQQRVQV